MSTGKALDLGIVAGKTLEIIGIQESRDTIRLLARDIHCDRVVAINITADYLYECLGSEVIVYD